MHTYRTLMAEVQENLGLLLGTNVDNSGPFPLQRDVWASARTELAELPLETLKILQSAYGAVSILNHAVSLFLTMDVEYRPSAMGTYSRAHQDAAAGFAFAEERLLKFLESKGVKVEPVGG